MDRKPLEQLKAVSKYDPSKSYEWSPEDLFTVSGLEIDAWNRAFTLFVGTPEYQKFIHLQRAAVLMQDFIKQGVEQGLISEVKEVPKPQVESKLTEEITETNGLAQ